MIGSSEPVLGGLLVKGTIELGTKLLVGPTLNGEFNPVKVVSLRRNKAPCCLVRASQSASLTLAHLTNDGHPLPTFRPGMVLVSVDDEPRATFFFQVILNNYYLFVIYFENKDIIFHLLGYNNYSISLYCNLSRISSNSTHWKYKTNLCYRRNKVYKAIGTSNQRYCICIV